MEQKNGGDDKGQKNPMEEVSNGAGEGEGTCGENVDKV